MKLETVACNQCGAPLRLPEAARYATCRHCGASLAVCRNEGVAWTEKLAHLDERTGQLERQVHRLQIEQELATLDAEWRQTEEAFTIVDRSGRKHLPPDKEVILIKAALVAAGGALLGSVGGVEGAIVFGVIGLIWGGAWAAGDLIRLNAYERARLQFICRRQAIVERRK